MNTLLLDTHAFIWWALGDARLPVTLRARVQAADAVHVSAASAWEIRTKYRLGKMPEVSPLLAADLAGVLAAYAFEQLAITFADGERAGAFPGAHGDPFDRMLAAQALNHRLAVVSNDPALDAFGVVRVWS